MAGVGLVRLGKELKMLTDEPPPGVCAWPVDDCMTHLQAQIQGPEDTPYERGTFLLDLQIPDRYPFEPPKVRFVTPIYHPNIDSGGRICLDTLKMRPAGSWAPSMNVPTLLTTIRLLMAHPNGDDGLMPDITELFLKNPSRFADVARAHVEEHARQDTLASSSKAKATAASEGSPGTAAAAAATTTTGDGAGAARGDVSPNAANTAVPASSAEAKPDSRSPEKRAGGGDNKKSSAAEVSTAAGKAGERIGEALREGTAPAGAEQGHNISAGGTATPAVGLAKGEHASGAAAAAAVGNEPQDIEESEMGDGSGAGGRNSDGGGGGSSGSERGGSRKVGSDGHAASSDDGAWSDSDDDDEDDGDEGPASAKRPRTAM